MARKPRIEFAGACYHVLNRGNYRGDLFETAGAAQAFAVCLGEACERMGWRVHAYCVTGHLKTGQSWSLQNQPL